MRKFWIYLVLIGLGILIKLTGYFFLRLHNDVVEWLIYSNTLFDMFFFLAIANALKYLKDRKWLVRFAWIMVIVAFVKGVFPECSDFFGLPIETFQFYDGLLDMPLLCFVICLFGVRKGPLAIYFRLLGVAIILSISQPLFRKLIIYVPFQLSIPLGIYTFLIRYTILFLIILKIIRSSDPDRIIHEEIDRIGLSTES